MDFIWSVPNIKITSFNEISEKRKVAVITNEPAWSAVKNNLDLPIVCVIDIQKASLSYWDSLLNQIQAEVVYAVGGGLAVDAAKYLAIKKELPLICLPTALSVDAITAWSSAIRVDGCVKYIPTKPPDLMMIDFEIISQAPTGIRAAAICDLLSIATGSWDWQFAEKNNKNNLEMKYINYIESIAQNILSGTLECAEAAGVGKADGLKQLLDCIVLETQLLNQIGHARPEEGSEHYFAYAVENKVGEGKSHASLVCPGILIMAELQRQETSQLKNAMLQCNIPINTIPQRVIIETLKDLPLYVRKHNLPYGIAHEITIEMINRIDLSRLLNY
jgi:glycerol-1-phosphate dehydrogenase [NAD(P)+]